MPHKRFWAPHYWPLWILVGLLKLMTRLPLKWQWALGRGLGHIIHFFARKSRHTAQVNLQLCFPDWSQDQRQQVLKASFINIGLAIIETALGLWGSSKKLKPLLVVQGYEYIQAALDKGQGVLLITGHFTPLQLVGRLCAEQHPFSVLYRPQKLAFLNYLVEQSLQRIYQNAIPRHDMRRVVKALQQGQIIFYTPDVNAQKRSSVFAPFFNIPTLTPTTPARLAELTDCQLIPVDYFRDDAMGTYDVNIKPPIDLSEHDSHEAKATRINQHLEQMVRQHPEQYLWQYKRFKTRPEGQTRFY